MEDAILRIDGVTKEFPGVRALDNVSLDVKKGEIHAFMGENGAGKSTLIKIISGGLKPTKGTVYYKGEPIDFNHPVEATRAGISVVHQELKMIGNLSVVENIFLGNLKYKNVLGVKVIDWATMKKEASELLKSLDFEIDLDMLVSELSVSKQQIVEICRALSHDSELIIMDEPSATLTDKELEVLFHIIKMLREKGVTIIYISHRLDEIFELADRLTVLRDGKLIGVREVKDITKAELISLMVGREIADDYPRHECEPGEVVLKLENVCNKKLRLKDISFEVRRGEILGISGLVGAGRTETAKILFGEYSMDSGSITLNGENGESKTIKQAVDKHIALVSEDRKKEGLVLEMPVKYNVSMANFDNIETNKILNKKKEDELAREYVKKLGISVPSIESPAKNLSGGNQQKVVLAKWLAANPDVIIFDEPTRGIDVGAKAEIYKLMAGLADQGKAIIMISSEMPELMGMSDRMMVMHEGKIVGELQKEEFSQDRIMGMLVGEK